MMERAFRINKESKYYKDIELFRKNYKKQYELTNKFLKDNNIQTEKFYISAVNKEDIKLTIISPTEKDKKNFKKELCKSKIVGWYQFKKNSKINKLFQNFCIENNMIINVCEPDSRDYFKSLRWKGYCRNLVLGDNCHYLKITSENLKEDDIPEGVVAITFTEALKETCNEINISYEQGCKFLDLLESKIKIERVVTKYRKIIKKND